MGRLASLPLDFYRRSAVEVAPELLGRWLVREVDGRRLVARIVETEAYLGAPDRASHAWADRRTGRTSALYRDGGVAYVYLIYGIHHMLNPVTDGSAVLIRAVRPLAGEDAMRARRGLGRREPQRSIASGPGRLCEAMGIDLQANGVPLRRRALRLAEGEPVPAEERECGPRVGVDYAGEAACWPLRFAVLGEPCVSRPALDFTRE